MRNKKEVYRVAICKHTKKEIIQLKDGKIWLCLHRETPELDAVAVDAFKAGQSF